MVWYVYDRGGEKTTRQYKSTRKKYEVMEKVMYEIGTECRHPFVLCIVCSELSMCVDEVSLKA